MASGCRRKRYQINDFEVRGETVALFYESLSGIKYEILIDLADLPKLQAHSRRWGVVRRKHTCYARAANNMHMVYLHAFLIPESGRNAPVDHINHNGLDNRRANLRMTTQSANMLNRAGVRRGNMSGVRGVSRATDSESWIARADSKHLGCFPTKEQAAECVRKHLERAGVPAESLAKTGLLHS